MNFTTSKTIKDILANARALRAKGNVHPDTELAILVLVDSFTAIPNVVEQLSKLAEDGLKLRVVVAGRHALTLDKVRGLTIMAIIDHMTMPMDTLDEEVRIALANSTVTDQVSLGVNLEDLFH